MSNLRGFIDTPTDKPIPKVLCLGCLTGFDKPKKVDGYLWCGCGAAELVYLRPVPGPSR